MSTRLFVGGLIIAIVVLGFNYLVLLARSSETTRELERLKTVVLAEGSKNADVAKKYKLCSADLSASQDLANRAVDERKRKDVFVSDLTTKIAEIRKLNNALKDDVAQLNKRLAAVETEKKKVEVLVTFEKNKCKSTVKSASDRCHAECTKQVKQLEKNAEESCNLRIVHRLQGQAHD